MPQSTRKRRRTVRPSAAGGALEASLDLPGDANSSTHSGSGANGNGNGNGNPNASFVASLPKIPGVPFGEIPVFLHALKAAAKFFQQTTTAMTAATTSTKQSFTVVDWETLHERDNNRDASGNGIGIGNGSANSNRNQSSMNPAGNVHDAIMNRMEAAATNANTNAEEFNADRGRQQTFVRAVSKWMEDVRFLATRSSKGQGQSQPHNKPRSQPPRSSGGGSHDTEPPPIPYSMFLYLWELQQEHKRVHVRRAALFLSGWLLLRSNQCRSFLDQETHLADWVSSVVDLVDEPTKIVLSASSSASASRTLRQRCLLQKEAMALVSHLLDKGYGKHYSKLGVAAKSLCQRCSSSVVNEVSEESWAATSGNSAAQRRNFRDLAILHGPKELSKVERLLDKAEDCFLVLVPRFVPTRMIADGNHGGNSNTNKADKTEHSGNADHHREDRTGSNGDGGSGSGSDSDESAIDWEDGNEDQENDNTEDQERQHHSAVERTMAAMEQTSGTTLFEGGALEIDFDRRTDEHEAVPKNATPAAVTAASRDSVRARRRLRAIVRKLSDTHLVRLSAWLDGLRHSDGLKAVVHRGNDNDKDNHAASLVAVSSETNALRRERIEELSAAKHDIARVVASASRLLRNEDDDNDNDNGNKNEQENQPENQANEEGKDSNPRPATISALRGISSAAAATDTAAAVAVAAVRTSAKRSFGSANRTTQKRKPRRRIEIRCSRRTPGQETTRSTT